MLYRLHEDDSIEAINVRDVRAGEEISQIIARDEFGQYLVSTVFLGVDHGYGQGDFPILFETMVFAGGAENSLGKDVLQCRYKTVADARLGHFYTVLMFRKGASYLNEIDKEKCPSEALEALHSYFAD